MLGNLIGQFQVGCKTRKGVRIVEYSMETSGVVGCVVDVATRTLRGKGVC